MEDEMIARQQVSDKLRAQIREFEREKRDMTRRYNEQVRETLHASRCRGTKFRQR